MSAFASLRKLANESVIYGISGTITRFLSVFLVPIYTRLFAPAEYGVISLTTTLFALITLLALAGLDNSVARWYYDTDDPEDRKLTLNTFLWACLSSAIALSIIVTIFSGSIAERLFESRDSAQILRIAAVNLPLTIFTAFTWNLLRLQRRATTTAIFTLTTSLVTILLNCVFVLGLRIGIQGIFYAQLISSLIAMAWTFILFRGTISIPAINTVRLREMLGFSLPLIPGGIAFWVVNLSGAYFVRISQDMHEVGLYQIGATVATGMALLTGAFQMAWGPFAFSIHKEQYAKQVYSQTLIGYLAITGVAAMALALFSRDVLMFFTTAEYADAYWVTAILGYNFVLVGLSYIASIGPGLAKNNYAFGISMVISAALLVGLSLVLVPRFGKEGAAIATLGAQTVVPAVVFWHSQRLYPIPYRFLPCAFIFLTGMSISFIGLHFSVQLGLSLFMSTLFKLGLLLGYLLVVGLTFNKEMFSLKRSMVSLLWNGGNAIIE